MFFTAVPLDTHCNARRETLDRSVEKIEQVFVGVRTPLLYLQILFELRQDPFSHSGEMDVEPIIVPIEPLRVPRQQILFLLFDNRLQSPHIVRPIQILVIDHEWFEHRERIHRVLRSLLEGFDRFLQIGDDVADSSAAPTRTCFIKQLIRPARYFVEHRCGREMIRPVRNRLGLDHSGELVREPIASFFIFVVLAFVEADETDDTLHIVRIRVARRCLENKRWLRIDKRVHRCRKYRSRGHIDRNYIEHQLFVDRDDRLASQSD